MGICNIYIYIQIIYTYIIHIYIYILASEPTRWKLETPGLKNGLTIFGGHFFFKRNSWELSPTAVPVLFTSWDSKLDLSKQQTDGFRRTRTMVLRAQDAATEMGMGNSF